MTDAERNEYLNKVRETLAETGLEITEFTEAAKPVAPDNAIGRISRMDAINNKTFADRKLREAKQRIKRLERVLDKAESSDLGKCNRCGEEIMFKRLLYMPDTLLCISCARKKG
jgi:DnaK suppressor protein